MAKKKSEIDKRASDVLMVPPGDIYLIYGDDGHPINPRGPITSTAELQQQIKTAKRIIKPLLVTWLPGPVDGEDGEPELALHLLDGQRRLTAAKAIKMPKVPVQVIDLQPGEDAIDIMLICDTVEKYPPVVLDKDGTIIGGIAKAVAHKIEATDKHLKDLADIMGLRADEVSAYNQLFYAPVDVREAVADGRLSISAFARMKHASGELQSEIVNSADGGKVSLDRVRRHVKKNKEKNRQPVISDEMLEAGTVSEVETDADGETVGVTQDRPDTVLVALNRIKRALEQVNPDKLGGRERYVWDQIADLMIASVTSETENENKEVMK